jgi:hypothetical protein
MEHLEAKSHDIINLTPERINMLRDFSTLIAVAVSGVVISFYKYEKVQIEDGSYDYTSQIDPIPQTIMDYLGYV